MAVLSILALPLLLVAADSPDFDKQVKPILASRCEPCHRPGGKLVAMSTVDDARKAGMRIVDAISGDTPRMPKGGKPLAAADVDVIRKWVASEGTWWSFRPLPAKADPNASIDSFIAAGLAKAGITASPEADKRTLIRRVYFDLHGLPPTLAEVEAFVADNDPQAYSKMVDRLLASPRYGERWARHWLDIAHYGDSHGYDKDKPRNNAWPYRDWVIDAFNSDKSYSSFIQEQIAGDVLFAPNPKSLIATGFLAAGPWDLVGHAELKEGSSEKDNTRLLDRDDIVAQVMSSFTSTTVHCARCHDHKFDPIPQEDYYNLQSVFAGVDRADRPFDDDMGVYAKRLALMEKRRLAQAKLQPWLDKVEFARSPEIDALTDRIQDGKLLMVHMGTPKTPAEAEEKKRLQDRVTADTAKRKELVDTQVGPATFEAIARFEAEAKAVDEEIAALPKPRFVYGPAAYFPRSGTFRPSLEPRPVHVLNRGSVTAPGKLAHPAALRVLNSVPFPTGDRRAALALWISHPDNVLTWRSIVNRVWHYHFGSGIVDSPNDFGRMGGKPSHPELLDWLAVWFRDDAQGSMKKLHRLILNSKAYKQSSQHRDEAAKVDGDNRLLWRMNRTRLDAESTRDAVLAAAGVLDLTMGGPAVRMFWFKDDHSPVYDYARFDPATPGAYRRSIYRFAVRSAPDPFMDRLDCPDPSVLTPARTTTLTAVQALVMLNDPFMIRLSRELAAAAKTPEEAVRRVLLRDASPAENAAFADYTKKHGLENLCRLLLNTNEFLFVD